MIRERTFLHLAIGLAVSLLVHAYLVVWGPPFALQLPKPHVPDEVEVQLQEWPPPPPPQASVKVAEAPPPAPQPAPPAKPTTPPDTQVMQEAEQAAIRHMPMPQPDVQLPAPALPTATLEPTADPLHIAQSLADALQQESHVSSQLPPPLPAPEHRLAERAELPPLPTFKRLPRHEVVPPRPATVAVPTVTTANPARPIKGPAAERRVVFQPPPPNVTVENETEIELRFWILPNGTVGRVIPLQKADPRLEALATNYLRNWRFNPLPANVAPEEQWGVIPFKFRIR